MAPVVAAEPRHPNSHALARWPHALLGLSVLVLFTALRLLQDDNRQGALAAAALLWLAAVVGHARGGRSADLEGRKLIVSVGVPAHALLLLGGAASTWAVVQGGETALVAGFGALCVVAGAAITLALELVSAPMRATGAVDARRVGAAARTAGTLVAAVAGLAALCFGVEKLDVRHDFSFAAPTSPSPATVSMLEAASCAAEDGADAGKPEVFLFFERGSSALGEVRDYFEGLAQQGARVTTLDAALDPALSKTMKVSKNGMVGFRCGQRTETWSLGTEREDAQKKLAKMDEEVRTRLAKLTKDAAVIYVTVGHGERSLEEAAKGGERPNAKGLKKLIESLNGKPKKLGIADGLTREVPADAALVVIPGPSQAFLPEEAAALSHHVRGGGSVLLLLDPPLPGQPDVAASLEPLLATLGVKVGSHEVLNDKAYVKSSNTTADHAFLYSTSFGSHKSVKTLSGARGKAALLFMSATVVEKRADGAGSRAGESPKVSVIARTPPATWIDVDDDRAHDEGSEARAVLDLAAAVEVPGSKEGRALVVGDSDVLADMLVAQDANTVFGYEALLWLLRDDEKLGSGVPAEQDVPLRHTRDEDKLWFYATIFLGPLVCLAGGMVFVGGKRRRRARSGAVPSGSSSASATRHANAAGPAAAAGDSSAAGSSPGGAP